MFLVFVGIVISIYYFNMAAVKKQDRILQNNLFIQGRVLTTKTSTNHSFGIISLDLDTANVKEFNDTVDTFIYPYKIKNGKAEVYTFIPDGISKGDKVTVNSNEKKAIYFDMNSNQRFEGSIKIITDKDDIEYVKENTDLRYAFISNIHKPQLTDLQ